ISTGASGIFGIVGRKNAKIRVALPDKNATSKKKSDDDDGIQSIVDEAFGVKPKKAKPKKVTKKTSSPTEKKPANKKSVEKQPVNKKPTEKKSSNKKPAKEKQEVQKVKEVKEVKETTVPENETKEHVEREIVDVTQESIDLGLEAIQKIVDLITDEADVSFETDRDKLLLKVSGGN
ncbi:MAG: RNA-binding protein, partial [Sulfitobacter sp.]|nr:RNA-binding protein [Sulfitobacter sp.]